MKKGSKGVYIFAVFFLIVGFLWGGVIYQRGSKGIEGKGVSSGPGIIVEMKQVLAQTQEKKFPYIELMWALSIIEILCCLFYLVSGFGLIRHYPFARILAIKTVMLDLLFKALVITFIVFCSSELNMMIDQRNILVRYYAQGTPPWNPRASRST